MKNAVTKKIILLLLVAFLYGVAVNIAHPVTPALLNQLKLPDSNFGYFFAAMNLGVLITAPFWGALGDKYDRKKIIAVGLIVYAIGQILFGIFTTTLTISLARFLSGVGVGSIMVSFFAYISKSKLLESHRVSITSSFIVFNLLGTSVGSALGGLVGSMFKNDYTLVLFVQAIITILFAFFILIVFRTKDEIKGEIRSKNPFNSIKDIKKINKWFVFYLIVLFMIAISTTNITRYLDKYFTDLGKSTSFIGFFALATGLVSLLVNIFLMIQRKKGLVKDSLQQIAVLCFICAISVFFSFNLKNLIGIYSIYFIYIIFRTLLEPITVNYLSKKKDAPVSILLGIRQSFVSLAGILGMIIGGYIYNFNKILLFNVCVVIFIICGVSIIILMKSRVQKHD